MGRGVGLQFVGGMQASLDRLNGLLGGDFWAYLPTSAQLTG